ncbi:MAG: Rieske 2Fe-2S domain-containing protein [Mycobacterium sp.]
MPPNVAHENTCLHQNPVLDEGNFDETITCAPHLCELDAREGHGVNPKDGALKAFPCEGDGDGTIRVSVP